MLRDSLNISFSISQAIRNILNILYHVNEIVIEIFIMRFFEEKWYLKLQYLPCDSKINLCNIFKYYVLSEDVLKRLFGSFLWKKRLVYLQNRKDSHWRAHYHIWVWRCWTHTNLNVFQNELCAIESGYAFVNL